MFNSRYNYPGKKNLPFKHLTCIKLTDKNIYIIRSVLHSNKNNAEDEVLELNIDE